MRPYSAAYEGTPGGKRKNGMKMDEIVDEICSIYKSSHENIYKFLADAKDFEKVKGKIVYKLIRRQGNEALLSDVPFMPYLDLAVVYYLLLEVNKLGQITALIHNEHLILWNINLELLHHAAEANTIKLLPSSVHETLLLPYEQEVDLEDFQVMVRSINSSMVAGEEVLSDHIYIYKREYDRIIIAV